MIRLPGFLRALLEGLRVRLRAKTAREWTLAFLPWFLIAIGLALVLTSFTGQVMLLDSPRFAGQAPATGSDSQAVDRIGYAYSEVILEGSPDCGLQVFVLDPVQAEAYSLSGTLPAPEISLGCQRPSGVFGGDVSLLVIRNASPSTQDYIVQVDVYDVTHPFALLAFPALAVTFAGGAILLTKMIRTGLEDLVDELSSRDLRRPPRTSEVPRSPPEQGGERNPDRVARDEDDVPDE